MLTTMLTVIIVLVVILIALLVWLITSSFASRRENASAAAAISILQQQLENIKTSQETTKDTLQKSLQTGQTTLNQNLLSSRQTLDSLHKQIGQVLMSSQQMAKVGEEVRRLQDILKSPKLRGQMGEWSLKNLLETVLPSESFALQHTMKDGKIVDALVKLNGFSVPIDAKFPLPSFEKMAQAETDDEKVKMRKQFQRDVMIHIDKIADSYIRPAEGTLDFALCYIPAENVYYETIVRTTDDAKDVLQHSLDRKVIPVSPNLLYVYLMTIVMGLHGMQIEKQAAEIRQNLNKLNSDFSAFVSEWDVLGKHIRNTGSKYDEANKRLDRFGMQLERIQRDEQD